MIAKFFGQFLLEHGALTSGQILKAVEHQREFHHKFGAIAARFGIDHYCAIALNPKEHDLLSLLLSQPGHLFPREEIVQKVWHQRYSPASRTLDVHVRHVRSKLELIEAKVTILAVRGVGYRLGPV